MRIERKPVTGISLDKHKGLKQNSISYKIVARTSRFIQTKMGTISEDKNTETEWSPGAKGPASE